MQSVFPGAPLPVQGARIVIPAPSPQAQALQNPFNTLGAETLTRILQFAADTETRLVSQETLPGRPLSLEPPALPSRLGRVCRAWREVTFGIPAMWTIFVACLDQPQTEDEFKSESFEPFLTFLLRSRDLPISIFLIRRVPTPRTFEVDSEERKYVHSLLSVLYPHFHRVETLVIETNLSSSLPDAIHLLTTNTAVLRQVKQLVLTSNHDDSILLPPYVHPAPFFPQSNANDLSTPSYNTLTTLSVDGRNIFPMLHFDIFSALTRLETLNINHLTYRVDGYSDGKVYKLFEVITSINLPYLSTLGFHNFEMPPGPQVEASCGMRLSRLRPLLSFSTDRLVIKETNRASMGYILDCVSNPKELCLIGCYFNTPVASQSYRQPQSQSEVVVRPFTLRLPDCEKLTLINVAEDDEDLARTLSQWRGHRLEIISRK